MEPEDAPSTLAAVPRQTSAQRPRRQRRSCQGPAQRHSEVRHRERARRPQIARRALSEEELADQGEPHQAALTRAVGMAKDAWNEAVERGEDALRIGVDSVRSAVDRGRRAALEMPMGCRLSEDERKRAVEAELKLE